MKKKKILTMLIASMFVFVTACSSKEDKTVESVITSAEVFGSVVDTSELETTTVMEDSSEDTVIEETSVEETEEQTTVVESTSKKDKENTTTEKKTQSQTTTSKKDNQATATTTSKVETATEETTLNSEQEYNKETKEKQAKAEEKIKELMPSIVTSSMTELQKVIAIHDWIVINMDYAYADYANGTIQQDAHTAYGGLETGYVVCNGYVELFSMMCAQAGIETKKISGYGNAGLGDEMHSWNQVKIDGKWYNVDLTWDDPTYKDKEHDDNLHVSYRYFLLSDTEFYKQHRPYAEGEYYTETPSVCGTSISVPQIIDTSVTKRAVYFTDVNDMERFKKAVEQVANTDIKYFAVYCMNGDAVENKRDINSVVAKTLKPYSDEGSELPYEGYQILFYERKDDMIVASNESECIEMIKKTIVAKEQGITYKMRCVNAIFADDKANYDGDIYYNKESARCEANLYKWIAKAGIDQVVDCISGDGYTEIILGDYNDGRKVLVAYDADNALVKIKNYLDTLQDPTKADIRLICVNEEQELLAYYLQQNGYKTEYNLGFPAEEDLGESVYMIIGVDVYETNRCSDFNSLKAYIEKCEAESKFISVFYYDSNITKDNYEQYMYELYKGIGVGTVIYHTYYVRDGVVHIE